MDKHYYRILQTHHACTHARAHTPIHAHTHIISYSRTRTRTRTRTRLPTAVAVQVVAVRWVGGAQMAPKHDGVNAPFRRFPRLAINSWLLLHSNKQSRGRLGIRDSFRCFFAYTKILGRTETRTRETKCFQSIPTVWDISRYDRAIIATCSLLTATDRHTYRFKDNYSLDGC